MNFPPIAILGTGAVGQALGRRMSQCNIAFQFGSRNPADALRRLRTPLENAPCHPTAKAIANSEVIFLAIPWSAVERMPWESTEWEDKILVDCMNPLNSQMDGLALGNDDSAAEQVSRRAHGAKVVKALNTLSAHLMEQPAWFGPAATTFFCSDHAAAKALVQDLLRKMGYDPIDAGPLNASRYLEQTAMLLIHLAMRGNLGGQLGIHLLRSEAKS